MFDKSVIVRRIENTFKNIKQIEAAYLIELENLKPNNTTGGNSGNAKISDPTANKAIANVEPKLVKSVLINYTDSKNIFHTYEIVKPAKWLELYEFVEEHVKTDYYKRTIFEDRYQKRLTHVQTSVKLGISKKTYFNLRNEIMAVAMAGACQLSLVKVME